MSWIMPGVTLTAAVFVRDTGLLELAPSVVPHERRDWWIRERLATREDSPERSLVFLAERAYRMDLGLREIVSHLGTYQPLYGCAKDALKIARETVQFWGVRP